MTDIIDINNIVTSFKRNIKIKKVVNLDENILLYKKSGE